MPKINISEVDNTLKSTEFVLSNVVYVPGFGNPDSDLTSMPQIKLCASASEFTKAFGSSPLQVTDINSIMCDKLTPSSTESGVVRYQDQSWHYARFLLACGYSVLYEAVNYGKTINGFWDAKAVIDAIAGTGDWQNEGSILDKLKDRFTYDIRFITSGGYGTYGYIDKTSSGLIVNPSTGSEQQATCTITPKVNTDAAVKMLEVAARLSASQMIDTYTEDTILGRGDCVALLDHCLGVTYNKNVTATCSLVDGLYVPTDVDGVFENLDIKFDVEDSVSSITGIKEMSARIDEERKEIYGAAFTPWLVYVDSSSISKDAKFGNLYAPSTAYLLCYAYSRYSSNPSWLAIAGINRGNINTAFENIFSTSSLGTTHYGLEPLIDIGENDANSFVSVSESNLRPVNPIASINNYGYVIWGNRTYRQIDSSLAASNFLNIRQLCIDIKKTIYNAALTNTFEPNSSMLWIRFKSLITPLLEKMYNNQGISGYKLVKDSTSASGSLIAKIIIIPIEAVETFEIELDLNKEFATEEVNY